MTRCRPKAGLSLSERALTYEPIGMTLAAGDWCAGLPGFRAVEGRVRVGSSSVWTFDSTEILRWGVKTRSGFDVEGDGGERPIGPGTAAAVVAGARYWLIAHLGPVRIREPVQVIAIVDEPARKGLAYGTLTGHPVSGEEAFLLDREPDGSVWLTVRSLTQPSIGIWRPTYPVVPLAQHLYRRRYLRSLNS